MLRCLNFSDQSVADLKEGLKGIFPGDLWDRSQLVVKRLLGEAIGLEFEEYIDARRYERTDTRRDYPNGYRAQSLLTASGSLEEIRLPRWRSGGFQPRSFERYRMVRPQVDDVVMEMFLRGLSTGGVVPYVVPEAATRSRAGLESGVPRGG